MKRMLKNFLLGVAALALLAAPAQVQAQPAAKKGLAVLSIASVDRLREGIKFLAETAGAPEMAMMAEGQLTPFLEGVDKTRPMGAVVLAGEADFAGYAFLPVTDLKALFAALEGEFGEPQQDNGVYVLEGPMPLFIKEQGGWAFVAPEREMLEGLPANPAAFLRDLPEKYLVAARIHVQAVPEMYKEMGLELIRAGIEENLEPMPGESDEDFQLRKNAVEAQLENVERAFNELDTLTIGWQVDATAKSTYLDLASTAIPGSLMARQAAMMANATTDFSGFLAEGAAVTAILARALDAQEITDAKTAIATIRAATMKELEGDASLTPDQREAATAMVGSLFDVVVATIEGGKIDAGAVLLLDEKALTFAAGGLVADGKVIEDALRKLAEMAADEPDFPGVNWNVDSYAGVTFHTLEAPIPDEDAQQIFGEKLTVVAGIGAKSVYVAMGTNAMETLKNVIDGSQAGTPTAPMKLSVAMAPIFRFARSMGDADPQVAMISGLMETVRGKDRLNVVVVPQENGAAVRIELEEGLLKVIGQFAKMAAEAGAPGGFGGGFDEF